MQNRLLRRKEMGRTLAAVLAAAFLAVSLCTFSVTGAREKAEASSVETEAGTEAGTESASLADGSYTCTFTTDSTMFKVNEACEDKALLTVKDGQMTVHICLMSDRIVNLYPGLSSDAEKDKEGLLQPTEDTVTYSDGLSETVNGFDVPVPALNREFDLAIIGTKGKWYDHKVKVTDVEKGDQIPGYAGTSGDDQTEDTTEKEGLSSGTEAEKEAMKTAADLGLKDGFYTASVALTGGSGRASVTSPAKIKVEDGKITAWIEFSSANYDYAIVDGTRYEADTSGGLSVFELPVLGFDFEMPITADTTAMSKPHEIDYTLNFDSSTVKASGEEK